MTIRRRFTTPSFSENMSRTTKDGSTIPTGGFGADVCRLRPDRLTGFRLRRLRSVRTTRSAWDRISFRRSSDAAVPFRRDVPVFLPLPACRILFVRSYRESLLRRTHTVFRPGQACRLIPRQKATRSRSRRMHTAFPAEETVDRITAGAGQTGCRSRLCRISGLPACPPGLGQSARAGRGTSSSSPPRHPVRR